MTPSTSAAAVTRARTRIAAYREWAWAWNRPLSLMAPNLNFFCSHRLRRACRTQARTMESHHASKRRGGAWWSRVLAEVCTILRLRTRSQTLTGFPSSGRGCSVRRFWFCCSAASLAPLSVQVYSFPCSSTRRNTNSVPRDRAAVLIVCSA